MSAHVLLNALKELGERDKNATRYYTSAQEVLLNLINESEKRDKMQSLLGILLLFLNETLHECSSCI